MTQTAWLLANPEQLSLKKATTHLVGRVRTRTPLGAVEFLMASTFDRNEAKRGETWRQRVALATTVMHIYRDYFPREYGASQSPAFSAQREQEFYRLVNRQLFPVPLGPLDGDPQFFYPAIPVMGTQQHDWENGCCGFDQLQMVFKLALVLSGRKAGGWRLIGLENEPAPPLGTLAWTFFVYALAVQDSPLRYLPAAFNLIWYSTGNIWLDIPGGSRAWAEWSRESVAKLTLARMRAEQINRQVLELNRWLAAPGRVGQAVEIWNAAARAAEGERRDA